MAELAFAQSFLSILDSRPIKLSADHVEDPKNFPSRSAQILPKMAKPMSKPVKLAPGQERSIAVLLKSLRNPPLDIKLSSQLLNTSILDIKAAVTSQTGIPGEKMKILYKKKPVADSKVLRDLLDENEATIEFSVMVIGGAAALQQTEPASNDTASSTAASAILETSEFWDDLKGFLMQRLKDEGQAQRLHELFQLSWKERK